MVEQSSGEVKLDKPHNKQLWCRYVFLLRCLLSLLRHVFYRELAASFCFIHVLQLDKK